MPVTLAQAQVNMATDVDFAVTDNFRRNSWLMDHFVFDDTMTPGAGGAALTYAYTRKITGASAAPRAFNSDYVPGVATRQRFSTDMKPLGASYQIDRALAQLGPAGTNEVAFQNNEATIATRIRFQRELLYGDTSADPNTFDGLSKALTGTTTELTTSTDWTTINTQVLANQELDKLDIWLSNLVPSNVGGQTPSDPNGLPAGVKAILGNTRSITRLKTLVRWAALQQQTKDNFGRDVMAYRDYVLIDLGNNADGSTPIIPINASSQTELYAVNLGLDSLHGAIPAGSPLIKVYLPDFTRPEAVQTGSIEMGPVAMVLKNTLACGVYRQIKV